ncbi:MAG: hypothetical protein OMM_11729 [Candidatus Magnetoglobus multicellularis str. Araruama]|uniref:Uncharacterized protein n=1 Tax=Candidatus Magnetoglobus multicellularis str. Araruama TaxID=890399 RepID=A0A1V1NXJ5_9BACT|nr:MAG: hypothetical protein OMM_11729 [Candidatus Magnetoglobus multicellularis str. Araruama]
MGIEEKLKNKYGGINMQSLPIKNALLNKIVICGNSKDCYVEIKTKSPDTKISFDMRDPQVIMNIQGKIESKTFSQGDSYLGIMYLPIEDLNIEVEIDFPGEDEEWLKSMEGFADGKPVSLGWTIYYVDIVLRSADTI